MEKIETGRREGFKKKSNKKKKPCALLEPGSRWRPCVKFPGLLAPVQMKQLPRADVYNHVLNKYWTENNKRRGMEGGREGRREQESV